jgi:glycerol-3-phosphate acyltransferase PlsX
MTIAVDAMGGDRAPFVVVEGVVEAAREYGHPIILVGDSEIIRAELAKHDTRGLPITAKHASEVVAMDEPPSQAMRKKKKSSIRIAVDLVRSGESRAFVSAGNTGAAMAHAKYRWGRLKGVERPAIAVQLPTTEGMTTLLDAGATIDCKPKHLVQFAIMGEMYSRYILRRPDPRVALLSIGEEEAKGNDVIREAFSVLKRSSLNFIGNLDGKEVYQGKADVIVCDGLIGNVALKISESAAEMMQDVLRRELSRTWQSRLGALILKPAFRNLKRSVDYSEYGGAPLLGVNGVCIIAHGRSSAKAIKNAIRVAGESIENRLNEHIMEEMEALHDLRQVQGRTVPFWDRVTGRGRSGREEPPLDAGVPRTDEKGP